jgi:ribosome-binding factor A
MRDENPHSATYAERLKEVLRTHAGEFLAREAGTQSLITVTRTELSSDKKRAIIYLTVLPENKEEAAVGFATRQIADFKDFLKSRVKMHRIPHIDFEIDKGEKNRQRLDELSQM